MNKEIKGHISRHKTLYLIGSHVVVAGITWGIMKGRYAGLPDSTASRSETVFVRPFFLFSKNNKVITVTQRMGRGRPGNLTHCLETGRKFASQNLAAAWSGSTDDVMSLHLRGKLPDVNGYHFVRIPA